MCLANLQHLTLLRQSQERKEAQGPRGGARKTTSKKARGRKEGGRSCPRTACLHISNHCRRGEPHMLRLICHRIRRGEHQMSFVVSQADILQFRVRTKLLSRLTRHAVKKSKTECKRTRLPDLGGQCFLTQSKSWPKDVLGS